MFDDITNNEIVLTNYKNVNLISKPLKERTIIVLNNTSIFPLAATAKA